MKAPRNTQKDFDPAGFLLEAMTMGSSGAIENQEAQGQHELVNSETLPSKVIHGTRVELESAGVKFGDSVPGDPLFTYVTLPEGWKKVATDHSMWSKLLDDKGRERAGIFYKAAFYDRNAHLNVTARFNITECFDREDRDSAVIYQVTDCGKVTHTCEPVTYPTGADWKALSDAREKAYAAAKVWLAEHYPDWKNRGAYWK